MFLSAKTLQLLFEMDASVDQKAALLSSILADEEAMTLQRPRARPPAPPAPAERVWVYVMGSDYPDDPLVKVGISKHPNHRMTTLERERPGANLYLAHTEGPFSRAAAAEIERQAHRRLAESCDRGEWFLCGEAAAIAAVVASRAEAGH